MVDFKDKSASGPELGPEITGTLIVGGRKTMNGRLYPTKVLRMLASNPKTQESIRTLTFCGKVRRVEHEQSAALHSVTYLGLEEKELRVATRLVPFSFTDQRTMTLIAEAHKTGSVVFDMVGTGPVDENGVVGANYKLDRIDLVVLEKHDVELPQRYVPKMLGTEDKRMETPRPIVYGVGIEHRPGDFGMTHGLTTDVKEMLEVVPDEVFEAGSGVRVCLLRFNSDGTEQVLYVWRDQAWYREA